MFNSKLATKILEIISKKENTSSKIIDISPTDVKVQIRSLTKSVKLKLDTWDLFLFIYFIMLYSACWLYLFIISMGNQLCTEDGLETTSYKIKSRTSGIQMIQRTQWYQPQFKQEDTGTPILSLTVRSRL